ncbi:myomegalin [Hyla sarda]|uniref:myomegalin n=1 Tax=Hyla sarda TaxID=327740 RepID=UPI0024C43875|nr:myomegalin [Hyla sarda]
MTMSIGYRTLSQHLNDLKKENFSLKLRIYFLEERIQHKYEDGNNDVYKSNIELKVEVESLKQELSEKQQLLEKVWADCGNLKSCNDPKLHQDYKQREEEANHGRELLEKKILFLQEEVRLAMDKADEMGAFAKTENENCLKLKKTIEGFTADMTEARLLQKNYCTILSEKDRMIQQMTHLLDNKDSIINQLTQKNQNLINHQFRDLEKSIQELREALRQKENENQSSDPMLDLKMKDVCRICRRELCGNQRRWIFHTTAKLNLQVILSHVLGKEILRDGHAEFVCSKCAFMLERFYRFDTVIARIEALSIERLQKLLSEKDRLKHCLASLYRKNNNEDGQEAKSGEGTVETANLSEVQYSYSALLQEDFTYSGFECWTELEEPSQELHHCPHTEGTGAVPRKCHGCSSLRVADSDYEAVCKVPRRLTQNISSGQVSTCTSAFNEPVTIPQISENSEAANDKVVSDGDGLERLSSEHSADSLDTKDPGSNLQRSEDKVKSTSEHLKCHCSSCSYGGSSSGYVRKLDLTLSLAKMFYYKPVHSPRGSKIPVKSNSVPKLSSPLNSAQSSTLNTGLGFLDSIMESPPKTSQDFIAEISDLQELWHNVYEDYIPIDMQNLVEKKSQDAMQYENLLAQQASELQKAQMEAQALQEKLQESKDVIKTLQDSQQQLTNKLNGAQELTHNQEGLLQSLRDTLQSRDHEVMELYQIIDEHNATIAKLQDMLLKCQNEQLQSFQVMPTQLQFLELQNTLFSTQMELQKKQMALRQKERQLTDVKRSQRLLQVDLLEGQQQKETTWKHNQELHGALHNLQRELQEKSQHLQNLEEEKCTKLVAQEQNIERLKQTVSQKEQILQEYMDVLHYQQGLEKVPGGNEHMMEKLRQRIRERDAALEKAVDEKFCAVEEKEKEVQRLKIVIREREHDLERLSNVLSGNEETINSLDNLVKAKDMELEQISAAYKNLQWLKQETEEKYRCSLSERESIILQLQKNLQERNKEIEEIRTCFLGKSDICSGDIIEELKMCLQRKEKMLQDAVFARNQQAEEHMREVMDLLAMISSEKMDPTSVCQNCLAKEQNTGVNQSVENFIHLQKLVQEKEKIIQAFTQSYSVQPMPISMTSADPDAKDEGTENGETLKSDLAKAREDLRLVLRKMREYQLEVSALQSIIMKQNEQLREQAADMDTLSRNIQIKEELIKDLQVKLVDPEDIPTVELLTQQIFTLKENIASLNLASQGHIRHTQKIFKLLEELAANKSRLNEALQVEKQLYSCLVQFRTEAESFSSSSALHNELLAAQALRGQLEDTLMRTMEQLVALQSETKVPACFGGAEKECLTFPHKHAITFRYSFVGTPDINNSAEKKPNPLTEPKRNGSDEKMKEDVQKLKNELQDLIRKKNRVEEELRVHKCELEGAVNFSTPDMRHVKSDHKEFNFSTEKASLTMEQYMGKIEMEEGTDMAKEIRKRKAQINLDENDFNFVRRLERNSTVNWNPFTNNAKENRYKETETQPVISGPAREISLKRSLSAMSPANEGLCQIPTKTAPGRYYSLDDNRPSANCLSVQNSMVKWPQQVRMETPNTQRQNSSHSVNEKQSGSQLDGPLIKRDTSEVHMDFQDLGYETCGKSENEIDREETTSPECEEDDDMFIEVNPMAENNSNYQYWSPMTPSTNEVFWQTDHKPDADVLEQHVKKLKDQLRTSQKMMPHLESQSSPSSKSHSSTEEDEGWQSDTTRHHSCTFIEQLAKRVSRLESYVYHLGKDAGTQCHLKPATSAGKYDWLIQEQARELSLLRQKVREGQSVCHVLAQHLEETIKSFEEMLRANDIDYFMGQSFREHLSEGSQLAKKLNSKLNSKGFSKVNKNQKDESLANSSHGSLESILFDDQLSTNDELDGCSELSVTSDCSCYEQDSTHDSDLCCNSVFSNNAPPMDTDHTNGLYILCHADDFNALKKNILDGKTLLHNIGTRLPFLEGHGGKVMDCANVNKLLPALKTLDTILEESISILGLFWSVTQHSQQVNKQQKKEEQMMKDEICSLKKKIKEQELMLQKASAHVRHVNLAKEGMEKLIMKQLTSTCGILKKARSNILVKRSNNVLRPSFQLTA